MLKRKVRIFGRSIPLAAIVALVLAVTLVAAAFLLVSEARVTGTAITAPLGNWDHGTAYCNVTGIGTCTPGGSGVLLTGDLVGVDDDTGIILGADWGADAGNAEAICVTAVNSLDPNVPVTIATGGTSGTTGRAPGTWDDMSFDFDLSSITPGYDFGASGSGVDVEWSLFSAVEVGGNCP